MQCWIVHFYVVLNYAHIHRHAHHVRIVTFWQPVLYQLSRNPKRLLLTELHQHQKIHDKVHPLTVSDVWVAYRQVPQN